MAVPRDRWVVSSEFATVTLTLRTDHRSGQCVVVRDADSGAEAAIGALELEALARSTFDERVTFYRVVMRMERPVGTVDPNAAAR
jgi:hypothetical protein